MSNVEIHAEQPAIGQPEQTVRQVRDASTASSFVEAIAGVGAVILAILGLAGFLPVTFASIATIALGAALLLEGGSIGSRLYVAASRDGQDVPSELMGGLGAESLSGLGALALGILALIGVDTFILLEVALLVFGAGLLFGSAATWRVNYPRIGGYATNDTAGYVAREAVHAASGAHALVGLAAVILGILALLGNSPMILVLAGILSVGGAIVLSGAAIGGRFLRAFR